MFNRAFTFNGYIITWDVSNVTDMNNMFQEAKVFNQEIGSWDVSNVTDMSLMFFKAEKFNAFIRTWDVSNVTNISNMLTSSGLNITDIPDDYFNYNIDDAITNNLITYEQAISTYLKTSPNLKDDIRDRGLTIENFEKEFLYDNDINSYVLITEFGKDQEYLENNGFIFLYYPILV